VLPGVDRGGRSRCNRGRRTVARALGRGRAGIGGMDRPGGGAQAGQTRPGGILAGLPWAIHRRAPASLVARIERPAGFYRGRVLKRSSRCSIKGSRRDSVSAGRDLPWCTTENSHLRKGKFGPKKVWAGSVARCQSVAVCLESSVIRGGKSDESSTALRLTSPAGTFTCTLTLNNPYVRPRR